ncbi:MAG: N-acetylhexosamine 1-kinase [Tenericutes bacterium ADurb.BinA124]|nr:MAG: N-acetylhexosamine 1-kinase [Tenericutes bacterium ADurb.BinA124]
MQKVLDMYEFGRRAVKMVPFGNGHINKTYMVITNNDEKYILQKINTTVFKKPREVMSNIELVTNYIREVVTQQNNDPTRAVLEIIPAVNAKSYVHIDDMYWRCYRFVTGAKTYEIVENPELFFEVGKAVGTFQKQLMDFPIEKLSITIPNFHNTPARFHRFKEVVNEDPKRRALEVFNEIKFLYNREEYVNNITKHLETREIKTRVTHNDTKLNNIMIDERSNEAICVIDLDTVMPGSVLYDFGDAIRVGASTALEDEKDLSKVKINHVLFEAFSQGFLEKTHDILTEKEIENLVESARIITLECGMRFLTDYLEGDNYFSIHYETHNLDRARTQFKLVEEIENDYEDLEEIIQNILKDLRK